MTEEQMAENYPRLAEAVALLLASNPNGPDPSSTQFLWWHCAKEIVQAVIRSTTPTEETPCPSPRSES